MHLLNNQTFNQLLTNTADSEFFCSLTTGKLPKSVYEEYLTQDGIYLFYYQIALEQTAKRAPTKEEQDFFYEAAKTIELEVAAKFGYTKLSRAKASTLKYIDYLMTHTRGSYLEAVSAIFPCFYVYCVIANTPKEIAISHPYYEWFSCYRSQLFVEQTETVTKNLDVLLANSSDGDRSIAIINKGIELELNFHQALMASASLGATYTSFSADATA